MREKTQMKTRNTIFRYILWMGIIPNAISILLTVTQGLLEANYYDIPYAMDFLLDAVLFVLYGAFAATFFFVVGWTTAATLFMPTRDIIITTATGTVSVGVMLILSGWVQMMMLPAYSTDIAYMMSAYLTAAIIFGALALLIIWAVKFFAKYRGIDPTPEKKLIPWKLPHVAFFIMSLGIILYGTAAFITGALATSAFLVLAGAGIAGFFVCELGAMLALKGKKPEGSAER